MCIRLHSSIWCTSPEYRNSFNGLLTRHQSEEFFSYENLERLKYLHQERLQPGRRVHWGSLLFTFNRMEINVWLHARTQLSLKSGYMSIGSQCLKIVFPCTSRKYLYKVSDSSTQNRATRVVRGSQELRFGCLARGLIDLRQQISLGILT